VGKVTLREKIVETFGYRPKPDEVVASCETATSDQRDALSLGERAWQELTWDDWTEHSGAFYAFLPDAFRYYLPSILTLSIERPDQWFFPADALIQILDRSPTVAYWEEFLTDRLLGLRICEYEALSDWLLLLAAEYEAIAPHETVGRAFDTVALLQQASQGPTDADDFPLI
jgi:hypothetical protein